MRLRRAISGLMVLTLLIAGEALAVARGQAPVAGEIVICSGFGTQVIAVDAEGNPVSAPHPCPDGLAAMVAGAMAPPPAPLRPVAMRPADPALARGLVALSVEAGFAARGPPLVRVRQDT